MKTLISCAYNMDNCCVELKFNDGSMIAIDTIAVENEIADNMYQRSELDWLFYTIEILDEAIAKGKQVAFTYNEYGTDKKLHPRRDREYIINPYQMAATNGRYYLIGNYDKYDNLANYRLDRITGIRLLDTSVKPVRQVEGMRNGLYLPKHMAEHLYMFSGESVPVTFRMKKKILNDVIDWFGTDIAFSDETEDEVTARVTINWHAMRHWALQYCRHVRILAPENLAEQVQQDMTEALDRYKISKD